MRIILVLIFSIFLCGCQNAKEIDERNFVMAAGIDRGVYKNVLFTAGCASPDPYSETSVKSNIITREENTLSSAMEKSGEKDSRNMYYGHLKTIILGKEFLNKYEIEKFIDTVERDNDISSKMAILYTDQKAKECIEKTSKMDEGNNLYIWDYYKNNKENEGVWLRLNFDEFAKKIRTNGDCFIPKILIDDETVIIEGGCIIKDGVYLKDVIPSDTEGFVLFTENCIGEILEYIDEENIIVAEIRKADCDVDFFEEDDKLICLFDMNFDVDLKEMPNHTEYEEAHKKLENVAEEKVIRSFDILKNENADAFNMSDELRKENSRLFKKYGEKNSFENMNFRAKCNINILSGGLKK